VKTTFEDMRSVIMYVSRRQVFDHHRDTLDGSGSPRSIGNVDLESVKKHLPSLFDFSRTFYHAAGPVNPKAVEQALEKTLLKTFPDAYREYVFEGIDPDAHRSGDLVVTIINKVGATDTQVFWVHPESISMDTPERAVADLAHAVMGGGLSGRLGKTLRTERGLTYHASSGYSPTLPMWVVYSFAGDEQLPQLLAGIPEVIEAFRGEDLTAKEIEENAQKMTTDFKNGRELALQRLMERVQYRIRGWDTRHIETYLDNLAAVTPDAIESFADRKIENAGGYLFLMGDATKVGKAIEDSGLPATSVKIIQMDEID